MMIEQRLWKKGDFVEMVDLAQFSEPTPAPEPRRWHILRVHPNRETKVMRAFRQRNICAYMPLMTNTQDVTRYRRGFEWTERRRVVSPLIAGALLIPDYETDRERWRAVDGVIGIYRMGECTPFLTPKLMQDLRNIEAIGNAPKSKRAHLFEVGQLVRVVNGPFRHFSARVERFDCRGRLTIGIEIFGRITPKECLESDIEAV